MFLLFWNCATLTAQIDLLYSSLMLPLSSQIKPSCNFYARQSPKSRTVLWLQKKYPCDGLLLLENTKAVCSIRED